MGKLITKTDELAGKTIEFVVCDSDSRILMRLADGDYAIMGVEWGYDGDYDFEMKDDPTDSELVALKVMSKEDYEAKREAARQASRADAERRERWQYEQLKQRFEQK
jgi:hypothetical protein